MRQAVPSTRWTISALVALLTAVIVVPGAFNAPVTQIRAVRAPTAANASEEETHDHYEDTVEWGVQHGERKPKDPPKLWTPKTQALPFLATMYGWEQGESLGYSTRLFRIHGWRRSPPPDGHAAEAI
jgi:hypothetical protein